MFHEHYVDSEYVGVRLGGKDTALLPRCTPCKHNCAALLLLTQFILIHLLINKGVLFISKTPNINSGSRATT